jgi:hypothetical protein
LLPDPTRLHPGEDQSQHARYWGCVNQIFHSC